MLKYFILILFAMSTGPMLSAAELAAVPLVEHAGVDAALERHWNEKVFIFNKKNMIEAYKEHGVKNIKWDAAAIQLIGEWAYRFSDLGASMGEKEFQPLIKILSEENDCVDPMVVYCLGKTYTELGDHTKAHNAYVKAFKSMALAPYASFRKAFMTRRMIEAWLYVKTLSEDQEDELMQNIKSYLGYVEQAIIDNDFKDVERLLPEYFCDDFINKKKFEKVYLDGLINIAAKYPGKWHVVNVAGWAHKELAWWYRGSGWAKDVSAEGWAGFRTHLPMAQKLLSESWQLNPKSPVAASTMISVAMGSRTEYSERNWFDRAVAAQFDYAPAYSAYEWSIRPRWGGSHAIMLSFAKECALTKRYDTNVVDRAWDIMHDVFEESIRYKKPRSAAQMFADKELWSIVQEALQQRAAQDSQKPWGDWYQTTLMVFAYKFGEIDLASKIYEQLNDDVHQDVIKEYRMQNVKFVKEQADVLEDF
ncbi:MAG: hypothetical protein HRU15_10755 [Planctomycetes bacterium]|nr:hypothetical protein [Planctomycetota bacterium]